MFAKARYALLVISLFAGSLQAQDLSEGALKEADLISGQQTWEQYCAFCHTLLEGQAGITGPNLYELFKRKVGSKPDFAYSDALKNDGREWTPGLFAQYVQNPAATIPGNAMPSVDIPADKVVPLVAYVMRTSKSVNWDEEAKSESTASGLDAWLQDVRPEFWSLYMENTVKFTMPYEDRTYSFVAYFNEDGTITGNNRGLTGIWRLRDKRNFCFAMQRMALHPVEWLHCIQPKMPKNFEFGKTVQTLSPVKDYDFSVDVSFIEGRPHPLEGDAHPDYWTFLFNNTMRYEIKVDGEVVVVNARFQRDGTIDSPEGVGGKWYTKGDAGKDDTMCYTFTGVAGAGGDLDECFALVVMFNPRVGARWPSKFVQGNSYWAEVFEGR